MTGKISHNKIVITNPISDEQIGELELCTKSNFESIINKATKDNSWSYLHLHKRCHIINKFRKNKIKSQSIKK